MSPEKDVHSTDCLRRGLQHAFSSEHSCPCFVRLLLILTCHAHSDHLQGNITGRHGLRIYGTENLMVLVTGEKADSPVTNRATGSLLLHKRSLGDENSTIAAMRLVSRKEKSSSTSFSKATFLGFVCSLLLCLRL